METKICNMKRFIYAVLSAAIFTSCETSLDVGAAPDFEVTTKKTTYAVGEEVIFDVKGSPMMLNFWSGELGNDYGHKEGRIIRPGEIEFSFQCRHNYPNRTGGLMTVWVSTDFNGNRSSFEDVKAATWIEITDRCHLDRTSDPYVSSGIVNVTDLREEGKPMYFAFKYEFDPDKGSTGVIMYINDVLVRAVTDVGPYVFSTDLTNDFLLNPACNADKNPVKSENRGSALIMWPNASTSEHNGVTYTNTKYTEEYFVTVPFEVSKPLDVGPDKPMTIKSHSDSRVDSYVHVFSSPGVYKVRFVGMDHSIKEMKETIKELEITVVESND